MAEKIKIIKEKVESANLFDFKAIYAFTHNWLTEATYGVDESEYSEKISGNEREIKLEWKATRELSDYFKMEIKIRTETQNMVDVEVEIDGKKSKMNKGKIKFDITGTLIMDKDGKWETSAFARFMRDVYNKYIIPSRVNDMKGFVSKETIKFKEEIKQILELSGRR